MNERLTALCEEAISQVWESRKGPDGLVRTDGNPYIFYEKFAELIVKECAHAVAQHNALSYQQSAPFNVSQVLNNHFGVKK
jgi:hypothetical protein